MTIHKSPCRIVAETYDIGTESCIHGNHVRVEKKNVYTSMYGGYPGGNGSAIAADATKCPSPIARDETKRCFLTKILHFREGPCFREKAAILGQLSTESYS